MDIHDRFLPCVDDPFALRVIADWVEENGDLNLARHLRFTADLWQKNKGLARSGVKEGRLVWARFWNQGWSRAAVREVTDRKIIVAFPYRRRSRRADRPPMAFSTGNWPDVDIWQLGERAWWDLEPRVGDDGTIFRKPRPRPGYGSITNAKLAKVLARGLKPPQKDNPAWLPLAKKTHHPAPLIDTGVLFDSVTAH